MKAKHTPRPWVLDPCGDILGARNTPTDNGLVCTMCEDRNDEEGVANGHLIVAAPDLLAAATHLTDLLRKITVPDELDWQWFGHIEPAIAYMASVIAKAHGKCKEPRS